MKKIEKYLKKLDQELQKFKLELEADHAGITSKLEQVISSKETNSENALNNNLPTSTSISSGFLKTDDSDFTLSSSANLMMMILNNSQNLTTSQDQTSSNSNLSLHKRKNSNFNK